MFVDLLLLEVCSVPFPIALCVLLSSNASTVSKFIIEHAVHWQFNCWSLLSKT